MTIGDPSQESKKLFVKKFPPMHWRIACVKWTIAKRGVIPHRWSTSSLAALSTSTTLHP
jgi:hypothetical protein